LSGAESVRVDRWLWAVRLFKTRSAAAAACRGGHVRVNDTRAKPAAPVKVGDRVSARVGDRERVVEVTCLVDARVGAAVSAECLVDHSPPASPREAPAPVPRRDRGAGRPTGRDRRQLDRARGRGDRRGRR